MIRAWLQPGPHHPDSVGVAAAVVHRLSGPLAFAHHIWTLDRVRGWTLGSGLSHNYWRARWQSERTQESSCPMEQMLTTYGRNWQINPCLPNGNVLRCVGFVKPEWICTLLPEQLAVFPPVSVVHSVINTCIFFPPFLSVPFFSTVAPQGCMLVVAGNNFASGSVF